MQVDDAVVAFQEQFEQAIEDAAAELEQAAPRKRKRDEDDVPTEVVETDGLSIERNKPNKRAPVGASAHFRAFDRLAKFIEKYKETLSSVVIFTIGKNHPNDRMLSTSQLDHFLGTPSNANLRPLDKYMDANAYEMGIGIVSVLPGGTFSCGKRTTDKNPEVHPVFGRLQFMCWGSVSTYETYSNSTHRLINTPDKVDILSVTMENHLDAFLNEYKLHTASDTVPLEVVLKLENLLSKILGYFFDNIVVVGAWPLFLGSPIARAYWSKLFERVPMGTLLRLEKRRVEFLGDISVDGGSDTFLPYDASTAYAVTIGNVRRETLSRIVRDAGRFELSTVTWAMRRRSITDMWAILGAESKFKKGRKPLVAKQSVKLMKDEDLINPESGVSVVLGRQALPNNPCHLVWNMFENLSAQLNRTANANDLMHSYPSIKGYLETAAMEMIRNPASETRRRLNALARRDRPDMNLEEITALDEEIERRFCLPLTLKLKAIANYWGLLPFEKLGSESIIQQEQWDLAQREMITSIILKHTTPRLIYDVVYMIAENSNTDDVIPWLIASNTTKADLILSTRLMATKRAGAETVDILDRVHSLSIARQVYVPLEWVYLKMARLSFFVADDETPTFVAPRVRSQKTTLGNLSLPLHWDREFYIPARLALLIAAGGYAFEGIQNYDDFPSFFAKKTKGQTIPHQFLRGPRSSISVAKDVSDALYDTSALGTLSDLKMKGANRRWRDDYPMFEEKPAIYFLNTFLSSAGRAHLAKKITSLCKLEGAENGTAWYLVRGGLCSKSLEAIQFIFAMHTLKPDILKAVVKYLPTMDGTVFEPRFHDLLLKNTPLLIARYAYSAYRTEKMEVDFLDAVLKLVPKRMEVIAQFINVDIIIESTVNGFYDHLEQGGVQSYLPTLRLIADAIDPPQPIVVEDDNSMAI